MAVAFAIKRSPTFTVHDFIYPSHRLEAGDSGFQFTTLSRFASRSATQNQSAARSPFRVGDCFAGLFKAVVLGILATRNTSCFSGRWRPLSRNIGLRPSALPAIADS